MIVAIESAFIRIWISISMEINIFENIIRKTESLWKIVLPTKIVSIMMLIVRKYYLESILL